MLNLRLIAACLVVVITGGCIRSDIPKNAIPLQKQAALQIRKHKTNWHWNSSGALEILDVSGSAVSDKDLDYIRDFAGLDQLSLLGTQITNVGISKIAHLESLRSLSVASTQLSDEALPVLAMLPSLQDLDIRDTKVTDEGLKTLEAKSNLKVLYLRGTRVTTEGIDRFLKVNPTCRVQSD